MAKQVTINQERKLYVIPAGEGYTCLGFQNCFDETYQLAQRLEQPLPVEQDIGTMKVYDYHRELIDLVAKNKIDLGTWFNRKTDPVVKNVLERVRIAGNRIRVFYGDVETGRDWMNEFDMIGTVGRSTGTLKIPLLIANSRSTGGGSILDACIVRIIECESKRELYGHPRYHQPEFNVIPADIEGYVETVLVGGETTARFKKPGQASRWVSYMKGERMSK